MKKGTLKERHECYMQKRAEEKKEFKEMLIDVILALVVGYPTIYILLAVANTFK